MNTNRDRQKHLQSRACGISKIDNDKFHFNLKGFPFIKEKK